MKLLENQFDEFEKCFNDNDAILRNDGIYLDSLGLCMSIVRQFSLVFPQFKLLENKKDRWSLLDSSISLIKTLDKRLVRMIPRAEAEIDFWMKQPYDKSHKSLILNNADILSMSLNNLIERFEKQCEMLESESDEELAIEEIILNLTKVQFDLEDKIQKANNEANEYYNENVDKIEIFRKYVEFKATL